MGVGSSIIRVKENLECTHGYSAIVQLWPEAGCESQSFGDRVHVRASLLDIILDQPRRSKTRYIKSISSLPQAARDIESSKISHADFIHSFIAFV